MPPWCSRTQVNLLDWLGLAIIWHQLMLWPMVLRTRISDDAPGCRPLRPRAHRRQPAMTVAGLVASPLLASARWP